jgi:hypothetical protein
LRRIGQQTQRPVQAELAAAIPTGDYIQSTQRNDEITQGTVICDNECREREWKNAIIELKTLKNVKQKPNPATRPNHLRVFAEGVCLHEMDRCRSIHCSISLTMALD